MNVVKKTNLYLQRKFWIGVKSFYYVVRDFSEHFTLPKYDNFNVHALLKDSIVIYTTLYRRDSPNRLNDDRLFSM